MDGERFSGCDNTMCNLSHDFFVTFALNML